MEDRATHQKHIKQEWPDERFWNFLHLLNVIFDTSTAQLDLHVEKIVLLPRFVQCHTVLVVRKLLISSHFFKSLESVKFAAEVLLSLFDCVKFSIIPTAHFVDLSEAAFAELTDRHEALLEVRLVLGSVIEAAGQWICRCIGRRRCRRCEWRAD